MTPTLGRLHFEKFRYARRMQNQRISRRTFVKATAATAAATAFGYATTARVLGANDRINFAVIGCGGMGSGHLGSLVKRSNDDNIKVLAVSDVYQRRLTRAKTACAGEGHLDYRRIIDRNDIDAV